MINSMKFRQDIIYILAFLWLRHKKIFIIKLTRNSQEIGIEMRIITDLFGILDFEYPKYSR